MFYRVFAQTPERGLDLAPWVRNARRFFEATLEILDAPPRTPADDSALPSWALVRIASARRAFQADFRVESRAALAVDWDAARRAERNGSAGGMGELAARCPQIWELKPASEASEAATLNLCALLASVALGPVLPPDESTLFGIRGAMERLERLTGPSLSR
ncbi:MAG TPA: hypothetical protein VER33_22350 [Polyangiaceae bacterium]|nr:hypothetical protein [Polyangiaceae bacterium]